jgi:hypothetical protein
MSIAVLVTVWVLGGLEAIWLWGHVAPDTGWVTLGYVLMGVSLPGVVVGIVDGVGGWLQSKLRRPGFLVVVTVLASVPAAFTSVLLTEGQGIARSAWLWPFRFVVGSTLVASPAVLLAVHPRVLSRASLKRLVAILLVGGGLFVLLATSFQPMQYLRPHRALILVGSLFVWAGFRFLWTPSSTTRVWWVPAVIAAGFLVGFGLSRTEPRRRGLALHQVFNDTIISQKYQVWLVKLTPNAALDAAEESGVSRFQPRTIPSMPSGRFSGKSVLYFTGDTMRADRFPPTPDSRNVTPNATALGEQSVVFAQAISNYSNTASAIPVLLSGDWSVREHFDGRDSRHRLPRLFRKAGYHTLAVVKSIPQLHHVQGFDEKTTFQGDCREGVELWRQALMHKDAKKPWFAWVHSTDAHYPHVYRSEDLGAGEGRVRTYDASIRLFDHCLGRVLEILRGEGQIDETIVVVTSDHGESLGEHGRMCLHESCYLQEFRIPLLMRVPGQKAFTVNYRVQTMDLLPTLANLVGLDTNGESMGGRDLSGLLGGLASDVADVADVGTGWALSEGRDCGAFFLEQWMLTYFEQGQLFELYDLDHDPNASRNVVSDYPEVLQRMAPTLVQHRQRVRY